MGKILHGRRRFLSLATALPLGGLLSACVGNLPGQGPPPRLFRLTPKSTFGDSVPTVPWQLVIELPSATASLDTTRVALQRRATEIEYYARANWVDRAPAMVQTLITESFENSGKIVAVGRESIGLRSDFVLKTELREFQAEYFDGVLPTAHVRVNAKLVKMPQRAIIGSLRIDRSVVAKSDQLDAVVQAFDEALGKVLKALVEWSLQTGQKSVKGA
ncbi:MAG: ABC-type transport auxiliary lipoprotein family protein [Alphaproteobacteria bacterium]